MVFNIGNFIYKKKPLRKGDRITLLICSVLKEYASSISQNNFSLKKEVLFLRGVSPMVALSIKKQKNNIIKRLKKDNIVIRDII